MTPTERYLLEMTNRGPAFLEQGMAILAQLKNIQQTLNVCCYALIAIAIILLYMAGR